MQFREVVRRRHMVRAFDPNRPVPPSVVTRLLEHAVHAPSAGFTQGWDFLVLDTPADRDRFWAVTATDGQATDGQTTGGQTTDGQGTDGQATGGQGSNGQGPNGWLTRMRTAPLLIVCWSHRQAYLDRYAEPDKGWATPVETRWPVPYWHTDTAMAALLMLLTAVDEQLGACFFGVPADRVTPLRNSFDVPDDREPVGVIAVGHPTRGPRSRSLRRGRRPLTEVVHAGRFGVPFTPADGVHDVHDVHDGQDTVPQQSLPHNTIPSTPT